VQFAYTLSRQDLVGAHRLLARMWLLAAFVGVVFFVALAVRFVAGGAPIGSPRMLASAAIGGVAFAAIAAFAHWFVFIPWRCWRLHRQLPLVYGRMDVNADEDGIQFSGPRQIGRYRWSDFRGFKENARVLVLCLSRNAGLPIPRQAITAGADAELHALLAGKVRRL
jgi:hypothetical protein